MRRVGRYETCGCAGSASGVVWGDLLAQPVVTAVAGRLAALVGGRLREDLAEDGGPSAATLDLDEVRLLRVGALGDVRLLRVGALGEVGLRLLRRVRGRR